MRVARSGWLCWRCSAVAARGGEEVGGVVVGEGLVEVLDAGVGVGGEVGEGGELAGESAQVGGIVAGPGGHGAVATRGGRGWL